MEENFEPWMGLGQEVRHGIRNMDEGRIGIFTLGGGMIGNLIPALELGIEIGGMDDRSLRDQRENFCDA